MSWFNAGICSFVLAKLQNMCMQYKTHYVDKTSGINMITCETSVSLQTPVFTVQLFSLKLKLKVRGHTFVFWG